jgi:hypothetical protein
MRRRDLKLSGLAERCAEIGAPSLTRAVLANITSGRPDKEGHRTRDVTVDEINQLALALEVPPAVLTAPMGGTEMLEVTSTVELDPVTAVAWLTGVRGYSGTRPSERTPWRDRFAAISPDARPLALLREIGALLDRADAMFEHSTDLDATRVSIRAIGNEVDRLGEWLESLGYRRPDLPPELAELMRIPAGIPPGPGSGDF